MKSTLGRRIEHPFLLNIDGHAAHQISVGSASTVRKGFSDGKKMARTDIEYSSQNVQDLPADVGDVHLTNPMNRHPTYLKHAGGLRGPATRCRDYSASPNGRIFTTHLQDSATFNRALGNLLEGKAPRVSSRKIDYWPEHRFAQICRCPDVAAAAKVRLRFG